MALIMKLSLLTRQILPLGLLAVLALPVATMAQQPTAKKAPAQQQATAANDQETVVVVVEGVGLTAAAAEKQAFRAAVQQGVGVLVDATTIVKNDKLIEDKILTYSHGFIKSWDKISTTKVEGLFVMKISAVVKRRDLSVQLKKLNIASTLLDGKMSIKVDSKNLFGTAVTKIEARRKATLMLAKAFEDWPKLLHATVDEKPVYDDIKQELRLKIKIGYEQQEYDKFRQRLLSVLSEIALDKKSVVINTPFPEGYSDKYLSYSTYSKKLGPQSKLMIIEPESPLRSVFGSPEMNTKRGTWCLWLMTEKPTAANVRWEVFLLDADPLPLWRLQESAHFIKIAMRDPEGVALKELSIPCSKWFTHPSERNAAGFDGLTLFPVRWMSVLPGRVGWHSVPLAKEWEPHRYRTTSRSINVFVAPEISEFVGYSFLLHSYLQTTEIIPCLVDLLRQIDSIDVNVEFRLAKTAVESYQHKDMKVFDDYDTNKDGTLEKKEWTSLTILGTSSMAMRGISRAANSESRSLNNTLARQSSIVQTITLSNGRVVATDSYFRAVYHRSIAFDQNGDGKIAPHEYFQAIDLERMGRAAAFGDRGSLNDKNVDGTLDKTEWLGFLKHFERYLTEAGLTVKVFWDNCNKNGDGNITHAELRKGLQTVDRAIRVANTLKEYDTNKDGALDKGEWCMYIFIKDSFDKNGDAKITLEELTKGFGNFPSYPFTTIGGIPFPRPN